MSLFRLNQAVLTIGLLLLFVSTDLIAQDKKIPKSPKASVIQTIGLDTEMRIDYNRPGVKGRKIWGELVPMGLTPGNKYSENKPFPWRAGANENSTFETSTGLIVEGKALPAGKYGIHMIPSDKEWTIIFSKNSSLWGSYKYNQDEDALRIKVKPAKAEHEEWLRFGFEELTDSSAVVFLHWEKLKVPFKVELSSK